MMSQETPDHTCSSCFTRKGRTSSCPHFPHPRFFNKDMIILYLNVPHIKILVELYQLFSYHVTMFSDRLNWLSTYCNIQDHAKILINVFSVNEQ